MGFSYNKELKNCLLKDTFKMGAGEIVFGNSRIYLNFHGEIAKKTWQNGAMTVWYSG